jgi:CheY-like chemotaxis protein
MIRVLIVEDNATKQNRIKAVVQRAFPAEIEVVSTINAAYPNIERRTWDLVVLDMTFQISGMGADVGKQALAGLELLQYVASKEIMVPVIVATQHQVFTQPGFFSIGSVQELDELLLSSFPDIYSGVVLVDLASEQWEGELLKKITGALNAH